MTLNFPIDEAYLVAAWLESFIWGVFTVAFGCTMYGVYYSTSKRNRVTTTLIIVLYILATAHMSLALARLIQGFIIYRNVIDPVYYFANISAPINVVKDFFYITNLVVGDTIVVWRLYTVWGNDIKIAAFSILTILGTAVSGYTAISTYVSPTASLEASVRWGTAMFSMSLTTNIVITLVTAGKIWYTSHRNRPFLGSTGSPYSRVILLIIESGFVVVAAKITEFTLFDVAGSGIGGNNASYIVFDCMPQVTVRNSLVMSSPGLPGIDLDAGTYAYLIILAVNSGYTQRHEYQSTGQAATRSMTFAPHSVPTTTSLSTSLQTQNMFSSGDLKIGSSKDLVPLQDLRDTHIESDTFIP